MQTIKTTTPGDAAVDGLIHGLIAGTLMLAYLIVVGWTQARGFTEVLGLFSPGAETNPVYGGLAHLAVSSIYGAGFAAVFRRLRGNRWAWPAGLGYGLLLIGIARGLLVPGYAISLSEMDAVQFALAHLLYGLALGGLLYRAGE